MKDFASDTVVLRAPKSRASIPLLRLIIGGVVARKNIGVDQLDDLQLAVETLVVEERSYEGDLTLTVATVGRGLTVCLGGLSNPDVKALLRDRTPGAPSPPRPIIDVRMLLDSLVDAYGVTDEVDDSFSVQLEKWIAEVAARASTADEVYG